jgi:hypothetical protein
MAKKSMIGNLAVNLTMETVAFERGAKRAKGEAAQVGSQMEEMGRRTGVAIKGMLLAGAGMAGALIGVAVAARKYAEVGREIERSAQLANAGVEQFQKAAYAAKSVGIESDKLADIYKDVNDKIGEFIQTGGGEMKDFFEKIAPKVGITAAAFKNLSGPDALQLYYTSLEKAGLNQQEMTFYMEALADEASGLIPLLRNSGAEMKALGDKAAVLNSTDIEGLKKLDTSFRNLEGSVQRLGISLARSGILDLLVGMIDKATTLVGKLEPVISGFRRWRLEVAAHQEELRAEKWSISDAERQAHLTNAQRYRDAADGRRVVDPGGGAMWPNTPKPAGSGFGSGLPQSLQPRKAAPTIDERFTKPWTGSLRSNLVTSAAEFLPGLGKLEERLAAIGGNLGMVRGQAVAAGESFSDAFSSAAGFDDVFEPFEKLAKGSTLDDIDTDLAALTETARGLKVAAKDTASSMQTSFEDAAQGVISSLDSVASAVRGGGFLGILTSVLNLGLQLGGVGAFGKKIQTNIKSSNFGGFRANGGPVVAGKTYMVGEKGPEWFTAGSGRITPMNDNGGGSHITVEAVPNPYFDVRVQQVAGPMSMASGLHARQAAGADMSRRARRRIPG